MREISAHRSAIKYLNTILPYFDKVVLSGHSKGGNLALYAAMFTKPDLKAKIDLISLIDYQDYKKLCYLLQSIKLLNKSAFAYYQKNLLLV